MLTTGRSRSGASSTASSGRRRSRLPIPCSAICGGGTRRSRSTVPHHPRRGAWPRGRTSRPDWCISSPRSSKSFRTRRRFRQQGYSHLGGRRGPRGGSRLHQAGRRCGASSAPRREDRQSSAGKTIGAGPEVRGGNGRVWRPPVAHLTASLFQNPSRVGRPIQRPFWTTEKHGPPKWRPVLGLSM